MAEFEESTQCAATTKSGDQCMNAARPGADFCHIHSNVVGVQEEEQLTYDSESVREQSDEELQRQLIEELDALMNRVRTVIPNYTPPPLPSSERARGEDGENGDQARPKMLSILERITGRIGEDLLDPETWRGLWYMASYTLEYQGDLIKRRINGDYETDEWGLDWEVIEATRPFLDFLYKYFWRVETIGLENIPDYERTLLVSNQTDQPPWDPILLMTTMLNEHPAQRLVRNLYPAQIPTLPFISSLAIKIGQALDSVENGVRLLEQEELVSVFPERLPLLGRMQRDRFKISRFKDTSFVQMAADTASPIVPVAILSSADTLISRQGWAARQGTEQYQMIGGILPLPRRRMNSLLPLPGKMTICFGEPILLSEPDQQSSTTLEYYSITADKVRSEIQTMISGRLEQGNTGSS
jgi:1-acyl-sn-glycerol-3-phosphate acyltransferase